jgi:hypothetical protein
VRIVVPLRTAPVALLWSGLSLSAIGDQLYTVALGWIAVRLLGAGSLISPASLVPILGWCRP